MPADESLFFSRGFPELAHGAKVEQQLTVLQRGGLDEDLLLEISFCIKSLEASPTPETKGRLHAALSTLAARLAAQAASETVSAGNIIATLDTLVAKAEAGRRDFLSWPGNAETYLRRHVDVIAAEVEERLNSAIEPSVNGYLVHQIFQKHQVRRMSPPEIRLELPKLHRTVLTACREVASPHVVDFLCRCAQLPANMPGELQGVIKDDSADVLSFFFQLAPVESKPRDATEVRNLLIGCLFGSSISTLSQTLLTLKLAALPVIGFMALGLLLSKADWNCRERDRLCGQLSSRVAETIGRCRILTIKHLRGLKADFLARIQNGVQAAEARRHRECDEVVAGLRDEIAWTNHRKDIVLASLQSRRELIEDMIQSFCTDLAVPSTGAR